MTPYASMNQPNTIVGPYHLLSDGKTVHDISIFNATPCQFGAKCNQVFDPNHAPKFSHPPLCIEQAISGKCSKLDDIVHVSSFIHREPCRYGAQCRDIDNKKHTEEYDHPSYCPKGGYCEDTSDNHEKEYRHLPLCKFAHKCVDFQKRIKNHCDIFRHYKPNCEHGKYCVEFHNREHIDNYKHPFPLPCPWTPYHCSLHNQLTQAARNENISHVVHQHCLEYAHVCPFGRTCTDPNSWHWEKSIHVPRLRCEYGNHCKLCNQEDHLNSFTHPKIRDIRISCKYSDKCGQRLDPSHLSRYRHSMICKDSGVVRYCNLNKNINFVQNQNENIKRVLNYVESKKWQPFSLKTIPTEIVNWIRTVQPVHRCKPQIFESIILHGHVMSLEYMDNLRKPAFVANSILEHPRIRQIEHLRVREYANHAKEYITNMVTDIYMKAGFLKKYAGGTLDTKPPPEVEDSESVAARLHTIKHKEGLLSAVIPSQDLEAIRTKTNEIAEASMKLNLDKAGIGYEKDAKLGTNKSVFSILGPHTGHYYGDVVIVFKREILHHPDTNFSIQAATSYVSGRAYEWRPWLNSHPNSEPEQIDLFHKTKLHASIPGYEYAAALELIAVTSHKSEKRPADIKLREVIDRWCKADSHQVIEAHLPQLIPLDYIDHIYMPNTIYNSLNKNTRKTVDGVFKNCTTYSEKESDKYNEFIVDTLVKQFNSPDPHSLSRPIQGVVITIPSTKFSDHLVMPLTISQANEQYCIEHQKRSKNSTTYIYWQVMNGDMMLTLSSEPIDAIESNKKDPCLMCYIAPKPIPTESSNMNYHEQASYLNSGQPFQHHMFISDRKYAAKSTEFYIGCNTDDFMTFCLEIQRSNGTVTLSHAGPNSIYNHKKISCTFSRTDLDLTKLEFIHVSAGTRTVAIRNLTVTFEKQDELHPTFDKHFKQDALPPATPTPADAQTNINQEYQYIASNDETDDQSNKSSGLWTRFKDKAKDVLGFGSNATLKPCPDSINCTIQFSDNASTHNEKFLHPCRFAELCRNPEPNLTHETREVPICPSDPNCRKLCDPIHRAQYGHIGLPYYLIPCRHQRQCPDKSNSHRKKYSHGEKVLEAIGNLLTDANDPPSHNAPQIKAQINISAQPISCKWGVNCRDIADKNHCVKYSHPPCAEKNDNRIVCKWGAQCHDKKPDHLAKYSHLSS
ncbi:unnamed protein product [Rotaria sordida]|uniref:Uncharacterized protein n=1 Tax=Rotaria sordida TaxID=392033 RepID=A0A819IL55_9BILA|nr:unnamed protein product [Rotaria sordida]CAF3915444.1 unnamed protein product [Rotaria sordida]